MSIDGLSIRDVTRRTGVEAGTLRMWEQRYDFPSPQRLPSGHRRYSNLDVELVRQVVRDRESGMALKAAIEHARRASEGQRPVIEDASIYSGLRRRRPNVEPYVLPKKTLISISHAIEDECAQSGEPGMLFGSFQEERFYRIAEERWRGLAENAECAFVLADFDELNEPDDGPVEVPLDNDAPLGLEWSIVFDSPKFGAVLSGLEQPGQEHAKDGNRMFETVWSVEPELVRDAATVAYGIVERTEPRVVEGLETLLGRPIQGGQPQVSALTSLTNRMVAYVSAGERV